MQTYVALLNFTPKGLETIQDSPKRADAFTQRAEKLGVKIKELYWTSGAHDGIVVLESPDEASASALLLSLSGRGFVHTQTLRAYSRQEFGEILAKIS